MSQVEPHSRDQRALLEFRFLWTFIQRPRFYSSSSLIKRLQGEHCKCIEGNRDLSLQGGVSIRISAIALDV